MGQSLIIAGMQKLRDSAQIARLVLVWFVLFTGVAIASPLIHPQVMDLVCTSAGGAKLLVQGDGDGAAGAHHHGLDCPLCAAVALPPTNFQSVLTQASPLAHVLQPIAAAHIAAATAPPLPSRGPPAASA